ncbi:MAG: hypothetical protein F6J95_002285 [Leptolyngbya sp. SIO1E4]|nr:hypothetical protein [Leptolyngbya sp. SIO1E4]
MRAWITALALTIALLPSAYAQSTEDLFNKIQFDLDQLDEFGLYLSETGKKSLSYAFCVPHNRSMIRTIQAIDPTVIFYLQSSGQAGCNRGEMLAIGHTRQPNYREVLTNLTQLDDVERIEQAWSE